MDWNKIADQQTLDNVVESLKATGVNAIVVDTADQAKQKALELLPEKSEVMVMTSETLRQTGIEQDINESGNYVPVKQKIASMNRETQGHEMQQLGAAPEWTIGSVHAVTEDGKVIVASNTGSQLPAYSYGADHVVWVVGAQKIVKNLDEGMKRIYEHILPLETKRARSAYGLPEEWHSNVSKLFILNKEVKPDRISMILVKESLGF